ncbi:MAG: mechanosensitive ion channel [Bacteriovoracaceae bacterium]|nr:mechanosensitive ion channel [Bacteriovoracaceae bacterium]
MVNELTGLLKLFKEIWHFTLYADVPSKIHLTLGNLVIATFLTLIGKQASRILSRVIGKRIIQKFVSDKNANIIYEKIVYYFIFAFFVILALRIAGIPLTIFTIIGGAMAIGVGFGSQNLVNNFISGVIIMVEAPIKVGDFITVDGLDGTVEEIGARSTKIRSVENKFIIVPNSAFLEKNVLNWTHNAEIIRGDVSVGVGYECSPKKVEKLLLEAANTEALVLKSPAPIVRFADFGDNSLLFKLYYWTNSQNGINIGESQSNLRFKISELFAKENISIPYPQRDVHLKTSQPIEVSISKS